MPTDDLGDAIAELRRLRDAASPLPWGRYVLEGIVSVPLREAYHEKASKIPPGSPAVAYGGLPNYTLFMTTGRWSEHEKGRQDEAYLITAANLAPRLADELDAARAEIERLRVPLASASGLWLCSCCGEGIGYDGSGGGPEWRWDGVRMQHKCPGSDPQAGHFDCRWFGDAIANDLADEVERLREEIERLKKTHYADVMRDRTWDYTA